jgi:hypothetical protein
MKRFRYGLYQRYGFYARFLTAIMSSPVSRRPRTTAGWTRFSDLNAAQQNEALLACQDIADTLYPGLDLTEEIRATLAQELGDTVLVEGPGGIGAFAICHLRSTQRSWRRCVFCQIRCRARWSGRRTALSSAARRVRCPGARDWHAKRISRGKYGAPRSLSTPGRSRVSDGNSRCEHAQA